MDLLVACGILGVLGLLLAAWRLSHQPPRLRISDRGILDRQLGLGWIRWEEIEGAYQRRSQDPQSVVLRLRPGPRLRDRLAGREREAPDRPIDVRLDLSGTDLTPVEIVQEILARGAEETSRGQARPAPPRAEAARPG